MTENNNIDKAVSHIFQQLTGLPERNGTVKRPRRRVNEERAGGATVPVTPAERPLFRGGPPHSAGEPVEAEPAAPPLLPTSADVVPTSASPAEVTPSASQAAEEPLTGHPTVPADGHPRFLWLRRQAAQAARRQEITDALRGASF